MVVQMKQQPVGTSNEKESKDVDSHDQP